MPLGERESFGASSTGQGQLIDRLSLFGPKNLFFLIPLFSNTYARSLFELLSQL